MGGELEGKGDRLVHFRGVRVCEDLTEGSLVTWVGRHKGEYVPGGNQLDFMTLRFFFLQEVIPSVKKMG